MVSSARPAWKEAQRRTIANLMVKARDGVRYSQLGAYEQKMADRLAKQGKLEMRAIGVSDWIVNCKR